MRGKFISAPAAVLVLLAFFLPWMTVSCSGQPLGQLSGYDLAAGLNPTAVAGSDVLSSLGAVPGDPLLFVVPIIGLVALILAALAFIKKDWERMAGVGTVAAAALGMMALLWRWLSYQSESDSLVTITYEPGLWLTLTGLLLLAVGGLIAIFWPRRDTAVTAPAAHQPPFSPQTYHVPDEPGPQRPALATILDEAAPTPTPVAWNLADTHTGPRTDSPSEPRPAPATLPADVQPADAVSGAAIEKTEILDDQPTVLAWLIIRDGDQAGSQYRLFNKTNIGRHPHNDIVAADSSMSAVHASVVWQNGQFVLHDLQSTNGVYVKESAGYSWQRVETAVLLDTMQIKLGRTVFHMMIVTPE